jgi:hypothetical protein
VTPPASAVTAYVVLLVEVASRRVENHRARGAERLRTAWLADTGARGEVLYARRPAATGLAADSEETQEAPKAALVSALAFSPHLGPW